MPPILRGVIYVTGGVLIRGERPLRIVDGTLVTEGTVHVGQRASLEITHSTATRNWPGLVVLDHGELNVVEEARLRVHGLVFVNRVLEIADGAYVDIVGSVLANGPDDGFINYSGTMLIRYDPAVLGAPGLLAGSDDPVVAWVAAWEELPR